MNTYHNRLNHCMKSIFREQFFINKNVITEAEKNITASASLLIIKWIIILTGLTDSKI